MLDPQRRRRQRRPILVARRFLAQNHPNGLGACRVRFFRRRTNGDRLARRYGRSSLYRLSERLPGTANDIAQSRAADGYPLEHVTAPVLVIHGAGDRVVPFSHGLAVAGMVQASELMAIEGGEHVSLFTHLDEIRERVGIFLAGCARLDSQPAALICGCTAY
jgi:pimeloyl-ACP methyl ester carboxylesterase